MRAKLRELKQVEFINLSRLSIQTKLSKADSEEIKRLFLVQHEKQRDIAKRFDISQSMVSMIVRDRCWEKETLSTVPLLFRFVSQILIGDNCWEWIGHKDEHGYGRIRCQNHGRLQASQLAFLLFKGDIPAGRYVCHECDNPPCVRPAHLFLGTALENQRDSIRKARKPVGVQVANHKLTSEIIIEIRQRFGNGEAKRALARQFGVHCKTIKRIVERQGWAHL